MHCVYRFVFTNRILNKTLPYYYIGSKSNFELVDGRLYSDGKLYSGSSKWKNWIEIIKDDYEVEILKTFDDYESCVEYEYLCQLENDVVANVEYFNLAMASKSSFANPDYGTFKHIITGKCVRLPVIHPLVINGEYVGATSGIKHTNEHKLKISQSISGELNPFYGKCHSSETKSKIAKANSEYERTDAHRAKISVVHKGIPKSAEHKKKIGRSGYVMLKHRISGKCIRIPKTDIKCYDSEWVSPAKLAAERAIEHVCDHCGFKSKSISNLKRWHFDNCKTRK